LALIGAASAASIKPLSYHWNEDQNEAPEDDATVLWRVTPDYGEKDGNIMSREADVKNGEKKSGWTNPLGWTDDGKDDDKVVLQLKSKLNQIKLNMFLQYEESEGPTKEDNGQEDNVVVYREADTKNGEKFSGWSNPLAWTDAGDDDDTVLLQLRNQHRYEESEGPTKEDNGDEDNVVVYREADTKNGEKFSGWSNPLAWTDAGDDDDTVLLQLRHQHKYEESEGPTKEDNGEEDNVVVYREADTKNGEKFSGWSNPLAWTDAGDDDDTVI
jgi:iron uptake system EfeUOB component EfeO/EfeM